MKKLKIVLLGIIILGGLMLLTGCEYTSNTTTSEQNITKIKECEHDWVTTSTYSFFTGKYKIISKCSKCGKVVE